VRGIANFIPHRASQARWSRRAVYRSALLLGHMREAASASALVLCERPAGLPLITLEAKSA